MMSKHLQCIVFFLSCMIPRVPAPGGGGGEGYGGAGYGGYDESYHDRFSDRGRRHGIDGYDDRTYDHSFATGDGWSIAIVVFIVSSFVAICTCMINSHIDNEIKREFAQEPVPKPPSAIQWLQHDVRFIPMTNPEYTEEGATNTEEGAAHGQSEVVFESGEYHGYYEQYGASHAFPAFQLNFDATKKTVTGGGWEEVGK
eukprot:850868_1